MTTLPATPGRSGDSGDSVGETTSEAPATHQTVPNDSSMSGGRPDDQDGPVPRAELEASSLPPLPAGRDATATVAVAAETAADAMEETLPILPTGFVENTAEIYSDVARFAVVPPEKLCEYWRVYTITHRKLYDPTANRLENFWWHVWGSQRRHLSGQTIARLFENISNGPTFVPLRMPVNRYDGPTIPIHAFLPPVFHDPEGPGRTTAGQQAGPSQPEQDPGAGLSGARDEGSVAKGNEGGGSNDDDGDDDEDDDDKKGKSKEEQHEEQIRMLSSSATRPPPAQSILRKPRPSVSGPRPTPRFALPSGETTESEQGGQDTTPQPIRASASTSGKAAVDSSGRSVSGSGSGSGRADDAAEAQAGAKPPPSSAAAGKRVVVRRGSKSKAVKKKFAVSTSAAKRRPLLPKRSGSQGSQSSAGSEKHGSRDLSSSLALSHRSSGDTLLDEEAEVVVSSSPDQASSDSPSQQQEDGQGQRLPRPPATTDKAAGKQPIRPQAAAAVAAGPATGPAVPSAIPNIGRASRASLAQQVPGHAEAPGSVASSGGSSTLEMNMASRTRPSAQHPQPPQPPHPLDPFQPLQQPGHTGPGMLRRESTMPADMGQDRRVEAARSMGSGHVAPLPPPSAYPSRVAGHGVGAVVPGVPGLLARVTSAPRLNRSMSQDSYGVRSRPGGGSGGGGGGGGGGYQSPVLTSATVAAPTRVDVSGEFMDAEGPDTFELYARTGLDEGLDDVLMERTRSQGGGAVQAQAAAAAGPSQSAGRVRGSFGSEGGYEDHASPQSPGALPQQPSRPLFMPTRPTPTPRIPFARTRSQLNVILDREKERLGEGNFASWQESRGSGNGSGSGSGSGGRDGADRRAA